MAEVINVLSIYSKCWCIGNVNFCGNDIKATVYFCLWSISIVCCGATHGY